LSYAHNALALLNDDSEYRAKDIKEEYTTNGVSKLTFSLPLKSDKWFYVSSDNLVLFKGQLFKIQMPDLSNSSDSAMVSVSCDHLGVSLEGKINPEFNRTEAVGRTITELANMVLDGTGWIMGDTDIPDTTRRALITDEQSAMANIKKMAELFDCDYYFDATLDYKKVHFKKSATDRYMVIQKGVNLESINVKLDHSTIITRLYVFGGNDAVSNQPLTPYGANMVDVNGDPVLDEQGVQMIYNKTYFEDYSYYLNQGYEMSYITAHPEYFLKESLLNLSDYVDRDDIYLAGLIKMTEVAQPKIDITFNMLDKINDESWFLDTPQINEMLYLWDDEICKKLSFKTDSSYFGNLFQVKVIGIKIDNEKPENIQIEASNYSKYSNIVQTLITNAETLNKLVQKDGTVPTSKLQGFIDILSTQLNSTQSHWYTDANGNFIFETVDSTSALKLGGGIFGLANSKNPDGSWQWRAFGTGNGFTATEIVAGYLIGGNVMFDLEGGKLIIGESETNYVLKFTPVGGLQMNFTQGNVTIDDDGITITDVNGATLLTADGVANMDSQSNEQDIESGYPLRLRINIDDKTSYVESCKLKYSNYPFRTFSKGADQAAISLTSTQSNSAVVQSSSSETINLTTTNSATINLTSTDSGGGQASTSAAGGGATKTSASGGGISVTSGLDGYESKSTGTAWDGSSVLLDVESRYVDYIPSSHDHYVYFSKMAHSHTFSVSNHSHTVSASSHTHTTTLDDHTHGFTMPTHTHSITMPSHSHAITMPSHGHSVTIPAHAHGITMPQHGHVPVFGILETPITNNTNYIYVDNLLVATTTASEGIVDLSSAITMPGWYTIEIRSNVLKMVHATVSTKSYIRG